MTNDPALELVGSPSAPGANGACLAEPGAHNTVQTTSSHQANDMANGTPPEASSAVPGDHLTVQIEPATQDIYGEGASLNVLVSYLEHICGQTPQQSIGYKVLGLETIVQSSMSSQCSATERPAGKSLRLFIVEGPYHEHASSLLAQRFEVDPGFFLPHRIYHGPGIVRNQQWGPMHRRKQPWSPIPSLTAVRKCHKWIRLRSARLVHGESTMIMRNSKFELNTETCSTGIWVGQDPQWSDTVVGIVMQDTAIRNYDASRNTGRSWKKAPLCDPTSFPHPQGSKDRVYLFDDVHRLTATFPWSSARRSVDSVDPRVFVLPVLYAVCDEWFVLCSHLRDRVIDLELGSGDQSSVVPHSEWGRIIPMCLEIVEETLETVIPDAVRLLELWGDPGSLDTDELFADITEDFVRLQTAFSQVQARLDQHAAKEVASQQLAAATQSLAESQNLARLTWLAAIFIPMTFVSGLFSMTDNVGGITDTFKTYFAVALPLVVGSLVVAQWGSAILRHIVQPMADRWYRYRS